MQCIFRATFTVLSNLVLSSADPKKDKKTVLDGKEVIVPVGPPVPQKAWAKSHFGQSEYLVYKESQAKLRYLLKFSFD